MVDTKDECERQPANVDVADSELNLDTNSLDAEVSVCESQATLSLEEPIDSREDIVVASINTPVNGRVDDTGSTVEVRSDDERGCAVRALSFSLSAATIAELMELMLSDIEHVMDGTDAMLSETNDEPSLRCVADVNGNVTTVHNTSVRRVSYTRSKRS